MIEDKKGEKSTSWNQNGVCVCFYERWLLSQMGEWVKPLDNGGWSSSRGRSIFISLFRSTIDSCLLDPPLLNNSAFCPLFSHFGVYSIYFDQLNSILHLSFYSDRLHFEPCNNTQLLISQLFVEILDYAPDTVLLFFFTPFTSQVRIPSLMSSPTSEVFQLSSGVEQHYSLSWKQKSKQILLSSLTLALVQEWENKSSQDTR